MKPQTKNILVILLIVLLVVALGIIIYCCFFKKDKFTPTTQSRNFSSISTVADSPTNWPVINMNDDLVKAEQGNTTTTYTFWKNCDARVPCVTYWCGQHPEDCRPGAIPAHCENMPEYGDCNSFPHYDISNSGTLYYQNTYVKPNFVNGGKDWDGNPSGWLVHPLNWIYANTYHQIDGKSAIPYLDTSGNFVQGINKYATTPATHISVAFSAPGGNYQKNVPLKTIQYPGGQWCPPGKCPGVLWPGIDTYTMDIPEIIRSATVRIVSRKLVTPSDMPFAWMLEVYQYPGDFQTNFGGVLTLKEIAWPAFWAVNDNQGSKTGKSMWPAAPNREIDFTEHVPRANMFNKVGPNEVYQTNQTNFVFGPAGNFGGQVNRSPTNWGSQTVRNSPCLLCIYMSGLATGDKLTVSSYDIPTMVKNDINWRTMRYNDLFDMNSSKTGKLIINDLTVPPQMQGMTDFNMTITLPVQHLDPYISAHMLQAGYTSRMSGNANVYQAPFYDLTQYKDPKTGAIGHVSPEQWYQSKGNSVPILPCDMILGDSQLRFNNV